MTRSWWGWGNVGDAVTGAEARELTDRVSALLPDADLTAHEAPDARDVSLPPPRVTAPESLAGIVSDDHADRAAHARGKAFRDVVRNLHGTIEIGRAHV